MRALVYGLVAGGAVLIAGAAWLWTEGAGVAADLVAFGLGVLVAPVAAIASATAMRATAGRVVALAGLAFIVAFGMASLADYLLTLMLLAPGAPGPFQGKTELSEAEVEQVTRAWLIGRHVVVCALALFGGSGLGVWLAKRGQ
jgi:hypothetical protein